MTREARLRGAALAGLVLAPAMTGAAQAAADPDRPARVFVLDDEVRLRRTDTARAVSRGRPLGPDGGRIPIRALRGETVAFQLVVVAGEQALDDVSVSIDDDFPEAQARPRAAIFRAHYLTVGARSHSERRPAESLGWFAAARPPDDEVDGEIPDALIPIEIDAAPVMPGPAIPAGQTGTFWVDVEVPASTPAGVQVARGSVSTGGRRRRLAQFEIDLETLPAQLPYRPTSVFVFYEADRLAARLGARDAAERQLWQLLHAHHIDALAPLGDPADVRRLIGAYDGSLFGSLFSPEAHPDSRGESRADSHPAGAYAGPGPGLPPAVVAIGAYGMLGDPRAQSLARAEAILVALPTSAADLFLYAIDESCASPRARDWKRALAARPAAARRLDVGQTCNDAIDRQAVDVALFSAEAFARDLPRAARAAGRRAWIYNGMLPRTGTALLDADPRGLIANGWIAAVMGIERWFYWESIFWDDDNPGGRGPIDPFVTAESFHNRDGDAALGDGLLLYPGRQTGRFASHSLGFEGVLPSIRLKLLRRGIEDAGLIALAAREHPAEVSEIVARALPAALDEARLDRPPSWGSAPLGFSEARAALRRLIARADAGPPLAPSAIASIFEELAARRRQAVPLAPTLRQLEWRRLLVIAGGAAAALALVVAALAFWLAARRRGTRRGA